MLKSPVQYGACISSNKSILPPPDVVSCLSLFEIIEIQQLKANRVRNGLEYSPAAGASSRLSAVKDPCVSELVSANSKFIVT